MSGCYAVKAQAHGHSYALALQEGVACVSSKVQIEEHYQRLKVMTFGDVSYVLLRCTVRVCMCAGCSWM